MGRVKQAMSDCLDSQPECLRLLYEDRTRQEFAEVRVESYRTIVTRLAMIENENRMLHRLVDRLQQDLKIECERKQPTLIDTELTREEMIAVLAEAEYQEAMRYDPVSLLPRRTPRWGRWRSTTGKTLSRLRSLFRCQNGVRRRDPLRPTGR